MATLSGMDRRGALAALNQEWRELAGRPTTEWADEPALAAAGCLGDVLGLIRADPDTVLAALLRRGGRGDRLAHRVVLQTMLGKAVRLCAGRPDDLGDAIAELWLAIAEYPLQRRPRAIAANLAWTVRHRLITPAPAHRPVEGLDPVAEPPEPDATSMLREAHALGLIDEVAHRVLWTVYVAGLSSAEAAARLDTTPEIIRWRCSRTLRHLAGHAELLAA